MKALVVFSGGQDSTTCLIEAINDYGKENVETVTFTYGQKHEFEISVAKGIANELGVKNTLLDASLLGSVTQSALFKDGAEIQPGEKCPTSVVDGRNMLFLLLAAIFAKSKNIKNIITGVCQTDFSGYPDCRDIFVKSMNVTLNLAMDYEFNIITPLMWLTKKETWALADKLGAFEFVRDKTHSCYNNVKGGCKTCPACLLREKGLKEYLDER